MITEEHAARVLHRIYHEQSSAVTKWCETWGTLRPDDDAIDRGLRAFERQIPEGAVCVLHGWIDQAALEIVSIGTIPEIRDRAICYRADQGGDTGILSLDGGIAAVLDISFEAGEITIREYQQAEQNGGGQAATMTKDAISILRRVSFTIQGRSWSADSLPRRFSFQRSL